VVPSLDNGKPILCGILYIAIADLNQLRRSLKLISFKLSCDLQHYSYII
jgi:hypothetical protein